MTVTAMSNEYTLKRPRRYFCPNDRRSMAGFPLDVYIDMDALYRKYDVSEELEYGLMWVRDQPSTPPSVARALEAIRAIRHKDAGIFKGAKDLVRLIADQEHLPAHEVCAYVIDKLTECEVFYNGDFSRLTKLFEELVSVVEDHGHPELIRVCVERGLSTEDFTDSIALAREALDAFTVDGDVLWELVQSVTNRPSMVLAEALHEIDRNAALQ